jgi:transcriptional regulator with XRE-family HTH domain
MARKKGMPSLEVRCRLANNVKRLRKERRYTQAALEGVCGLYRKYISNVEQGKVNITLSNLEKLAEGLGCTLEDLVRRQTSPEVSVAETTGGHRVSQAP